MQSGKNTMRLFMLILMLMTISSAAIAQKTNQEKAANALQGREIRVQNVYHRNYQSLCGTWHYFPDVQQMGYYNYRNMVMPHTFGDNYKPRRRDELVEYNFDLSEKIAIPSDWNSANPRYEFYEGCMWMRKEFDFNKQTAAEGSRQVVYFGAVNYHCIVWVNGKEVGSHEGGFTPFAFDVTDCLRDGNNFIVLKIDNTRRRESIPTNIFDWWNYGGITRDVMLVTLPKTYISDYRIQLSRTDYRTIDGYVTLSDAAAGQKITFNIPELKIKKTLTTDATGKAAFSIKAKPQLWSPENPKLYDISFHAATDTLCDEVGLRTIETRGHEILLNGKPIFLRGVCAHEEKLGQFGRANSTADAERLFAEARAMGCNFLRLAHYPHNEHAIRLADKLGLMLWSEIPLYWTIDWDNPATFACAQRQLTDMIERDANRASVIIWSVANETPMSASRNKFLSALATKARQMDPTRLVSMAMEVTGAQNFVNRLEDPMHEYVDVISFNQYVGWYRNVADAEKMQWVIPYDKPVIVSEFGGGAIYGRHGDKGERWTEEFLSNLYRQNFDMLSRIPQLSGTCPWVLADFRSPRRPLYGTQDFYNRKGLVSNNGDRKQAFYVVKEWNEKKAAEYKNR